MAAAAAASKEFPRIISNNLLTKSAFLSYSRYLAFGFGYFYAFCKALYLQSYVETEDQKKFAQLREAEISVNTLRGVTFHGPQLWDPEYTELQMKFRDCYPDFYLHPNDEFVYQTTRGRQREQKVKEDMHSEAVAFLKEWKASEGKR
mmetsp:Transcript_29209/g.46300  ORF Transcript_29209/g.46300 Transcript_29209/m.46300 type:complete len:147 (+) Transcript_29209:126-566(+)|eukprot:CAMPEP_0197028168 /NCGR_PEP_ID=MMETSP1384-20130603/7920_1 /TAXON_ID=29189 /ORGANISM="Ammonia sp." /LENGTH=146 /DNA_ID=CAMNT_0042457131 /DNA_START=116 /DNA_END=556 /DNA_ORIENTATION=-